MTKTFLDEIKDKAAKALGWVSGGSQADSNDATNSASWRDFVTTEPRPKTASDKDPELLLLHGLFGALSNWEGVLPLFSNYSHPIALQLPILSAPRSEVKIQSLAAHAKRFVDSRANMAPIAICGNSLGGHVALRMTLANPEMVDCLILTGTSGLYEHTVDALPVRPDHRFVREHMTRVFYHSRFITEEAILEIAEILKSKQNTLNLIHAARSAKKDNLYDLLPTIKCPVLLLWGEDDQVTTMDVAETFHKRIPNSELVTIKGCGHAPMIEHPEWFSENVQNFLKKHSRHLNNK
jgi:pimeloyl-ACP methyl ester carboxylesterase